MVRFMKVVRDCFDQPVRITDERLAHILEHEEMAGMESEMERYCKSPPGYGKVPLE